MKSISKAVSQYYYLLNILDKICEVDITHTEAAAVVSGKCNLHLQIKTIHIWIYFTILTLL